MTEKDAAEDIVQDMEDNDNNNNNQIPDIESFGGEDLEPEDPSALKTNQNSNQNKNDKSQILKTRTYDLSITYDLYYQTPRFWLCGYKEVKKKSWLESIL